MWCPEDPMFRLGLQSSLLLPADSALGPTACGGYFLAWDGLLGLCLGHCPPGAFASVWPRGLTGLTASPFSLSCP